MYLSSIFFWKLASLNYFNNALFVVLYDDPERVLFATFECVNENIYSFWQTTK